MVENQLTHGLKRQYAYTLGMIARGEDRSEDLAHLAAVICIFQPDADLAAIRPVRPCRKDRAKWLQAGLEVLRKEGSPMTGRAIARRLLEARGIPLTEKNLKRAECSLYFSFGRMEGDGLMRAEGSPKRWAVERDEGPEA
jgi:hypothetical protein